MIVMIFVTQNNFKKGPGISVSLDFTQDYCAKRQICKVQTEFDWQNLRVGTKPST